MAIFTIWDNRLDTGQQVTHLVARHHFVRAERLTIDVSYKSGHDDEGVYLRAGAASAEYDWGRWFAKAAVDGHANFGDATMFRFGGGLRFNPFLDSSLLPSDFFLQILLSAARSRITELWASPIDAA